MKKQLIGKAEELKTEGNRATMRRILRFISVITNVNFMVSARVRGEVSTPKGRTLRLRPSRLTHKQTIPPNK